MIRCKSDEEQHVSDLKVLPQHTCSREIIRCYQLPLNAITSTVKFLLLEQKQTLIVKCDKERPIKLAVALS
uniref:Uncharacterized protein n=1 Tax=Romanomermis culicivorax TaxID=13658 RepID=A0A915K5A9_ROMCU